MPASMLGITMIAAAIAAVIFAVLSIVRRARGRKAAWRKYALLVSLALGVSSFIALGNTYEVPEKPSMEADMESRTTESTLKAEQSDAIMQETDSAGTDMPANSTESAHNTDSDTGTPVSSPPGAQEYEPSGSPDAIGAIVVAPASTPEQSEKPDYDAKIAEMKGTITSEALEALSGRFDTSVDPEIVFNPYNGSLLIKSQASDNLTASLIRKGILADIRDFLEAIHFDVEGFDLPVGKETIPIYGIESVTFNITFPATDATGTSEPVIILKANFSKATLQEINWENKLAVDVEKLADSFWYIN